MFFLYSLISDQIERNDGDKSISDKNLETLYIWMIISDYFEWKDEEKSVWLDGVKWWEKRDEPGRRFPATPRDESCSPGTEMETF